MRITSPGKVLFGERGETKLDLVRYYAAVAEPLLRTMGGRPVLMQRFPQGASGKSFFQKRVPDNAPDWLQTTTVETVNGTPSRALVAADAAHVAWAVNLACLGFHVWPYLAADPAHTDELRLDLDPQPGTGFAEARAAAWELKALLDELGIAGFPKTTGNRGLHVYVRLAAALGLLPGALGRGRRRARARAPPARHPHRRLVEGGARPAHLRRLQPERAAQDGLRRVVGARARKGAQVSTPLSWDELDDVDPDELTLATVPERSARRRPVGRRSTTRRSRWSRCSSCTSATGPNGLMDAPWPPVYPKQPDEPPRVAPSRARRPDP